MPGLVSSATSSSDRPASRSSLALASRPSSSRLKSRSNMARCMASKMSLMLKSSPSFGAISTSIVLADPPQVAGGYVIDLIVGKVGRALITVRGRDLRFPSGSVPSVTATRPASPMRQGGGSGCYPPAGPVLSAGRKLK